MRIVTLILLLTITTALFIIADTRGWRNKLKKP